nr:transposase (putative), gypsy type [Tanacetum cinerariifolium]
MGRDTVQLETSVSTISQEYLLEFTFEYGISEDLHPEVPGPEERIVDFSEGKTRGYFLLLWTGAQVLQRMRCQPRTPIPQRLTEDQDQETVALEVPPLEIVKTTGVALEAGLVEEIAAMGPRVIKERCKRGNDRSTIGEKSLASMGLRTRSTFPVPTSQETPADVNDPDPLSFANPQSIPIENVAQSSKGAAVAGDPESKNTSFTSIVGLPESIYQSKWGVTNGFHLNCPEAYQDLVDHKAPPGIQARENEIKNLEALLKAETDMKKSAEAKNADLGKELKTSALYFQTSKIDFDEELYPHMLTAIAGRRWVIGHGLCLAVMKCGESTKLRHAFADVVSVRIAKGMSEGVKYGVEHGKANLDLEAIEAYDLKADTKYSDIGEDAPQWIREVRPSSSQLKVLVYPEARDPKDPWSFKEEILLVDSISANVSRAEKKKRCRVVCHTHGVSFAHHARSDGVPVSVPTVAPQGLAILLEFALVVSHVIHGSLLVCT